MNCEFCGTCVCSKHTDKQIGSKIGGGLFLLIPGTIIYVMGIEFLRFPNEPLLELGGIFFITAGLAELLYGQKCIKCGEKLKEL